MKLLLTILVIYFSVFDAFAQPPNNACSGAQATVDDGTCYNGDNISANDLLSGEAGCATAGPANQHRDAWYSFVASGGGVTYNITSGTLGTIEFVLMSSTGPCSGLTLAGSACGASPLTGSIGGLTPGVTYYYVISAPSNTQGTFTTCMTTVPVPANDLSCGAISLTPNGANNCSNNSGATSTGDNTASCFTTENGMWYSVTVSTVPSLLTIGTDASTTNFDAQIAIFSSSDNTCTGTLTEIACDDNSGTGSNPLASVSITVAGTYFAYIDGFAGAVGDFCIGATLETCSDGIQNQNESGVDCGGVCTACTGAAGYLHPSSGVQGTFVGNCMVNTCSGNYYDDGGSAGNYSNNIGSGGTGIYRTFCPDVAGQCMTATFTSFNVEAAMMGCYDYLIIRDGPTQTSSIIAGICGSGIPGPYTSTDASGCLTFQFYSDFSVTLSGWAITLSCSACAGGPTGADMTDCVNAYEVCANTGLVGASTGPGIVSDGCNTVTGCQISENFASWYKITIQSSGTMAPVITPAGGEDYDFALYQASACAALGTPVRCSYAAGNTTTGMAAGSGDLSEDVTGDSWVDPINVTAGDEYYFLVNKWDAGGSGFSLDWGLTNGASIACNPLPIQLGSFTAEPNGNAVDIDWVTYSEQNNDYFTIERSVDGKTFEDLGIVDGVEGGNSNEKRVYMSLDPKPHLGLSYYRLKQTDFDGTSTYSQVVAVKFGMSGNIAVFPNPSKGIFDLNFDNAMKGIYEINIVDMMGRQVYFESFIVKTKQVNKSLTLSNLPKGIYALSLANGVENVILKLFIE